MELMWKMTKPLRGTGKTVIMDSGLFLLKGLVGMYEIEVCGSAVVKNRSYWPQGIN